MEYMTISEVSKKYAISTRMLRHYEKVGLIESMHREDYAYRIYDECAIRRLQQIVILRKLQIPLKQIQIILDGDISQAIDILEKHIEEMDSSISVMQRMRQALLSLVEQLQQSSQETFYSQLVNNNTVLEITNELPLSKNQLKEEIVMSEAKEMVKKAAKLSNHVRYVGWDVGMSVNGPVLIEGNQFPGHDIYQVAEKMKDGDLGVLPMFEEAMK